VGHGFLLFLPLSLILSSMCVCGVVGVVLFIAVGCAVVSLVCLMNFPYLNKFTPDGDELICHDNAVSRYFLLAFDLVYAYSYASICQTCVCL